MQLTTILLTTLTAALTATAAPLEARACKAIYPSLNYFRVIKNAQDGSVPQDVSFDVPAGAGGPCSLVASFPAGQTFWGNSPPVSLNVIDVNGPTPGSIVGTTTFEAGKTATINSFSCRPNMQFQFVVAGNEGFVGYQPPTGPGGVNVGVHLTHSC